MSKQDSTHVARVLGALMLLGMEQGLIDHGDARKIHEAMVGAGLWDRA
jgi:hypothetical protein